MWTEYTQFATIGRMASELDYLQRIRAASVYDVAVNSPLDRAKNLSERLDNQVWLKREDLQPVFSFKLRGAYNKLAALDDNRLSPRAERSVESVKRDHSLKTRIVSVILECRFGLPFRLQNFLKLRRVIQIAVGEHAVQSGYDRDLLFVGRCSAHIGHIHF